MINVNTLKKKLALLERLPEPAVNRAAQPLFNLRKTWEKKDQEKRRGLTRVMVCDACTKRIIWVKVNPD